MKRAALFLSVISCLFLFSCGNTLLPSPVIKSGNSTGEGGSSPGRDSWGAPANPKASQGYKKKITLSWDSVKNAQRYIIYKADSPLSEFVKCAETSNDSASFTFNVPDGSSIYYKVAAVNRIGEISPLSYYVRGTSLAQPVISDVQEPQNIIGAVTVYWFMNNIDSTTYQKDVRYIVYCYENNIEKTRLAVDGSLTESTEATFYNLSPNTNFSYQVEAYLVQDQSSSVQSDKIDAATARRLRPNPVYNLQAGRGTAANSISLSFILPDMTDVSAGNNAYESHPNYFEISRRKAGTSDAFEIVCPYFGIDSAKAALKGSNSKTFENYIPGETVEWKDKGIAEANRGVEYEYKVQSYVDGVNRVISSNSSIAYTTGWAMTKPSLAFKTTEYTLNGDGDKYASAILPLAFSHIDKDVVYTYTLTETIDPLPVYHPNNPDGQIINKEETKDLNWVTNYKAIIDLTQKTTSTSKGRGLYSYKVTVFLDGVEIETVNTIGSRLISENTEVVTVENFDVEDGYPDKFIISWDRDANKKYFLKFSEDGIGAPSTWPDIKVFEADPSADGSQCRYPLSSQSGVSGYFAMGAENEIGVSSGDYEPTQKKSTMTVPVLTASGANSYSDITLEWAPVEKADFYRIEYTYTTEAYARTITLDASSLVPNSHDMYDYTFTLYDSDNALVGGAPVSVKLHALNEARKAQNGDNVEIKTTSVPVSTSVVGPARINPSVSTVYQANKIAVSWDQVSGAKGYYIVRRYEKKANNSTILGNPVYYYVDTADSSKINGKDLKADAQGTPSDTFDVFAGITLASNRFTLTDNYLDDPNYSSKKSGYVAAYADEQNELAWGNPYRYYVFPVLSEDDKPVFENGNVKVGSISYRNHSSLEKRGYTIGFAVNILATKGTGTSKNDGTFSVNNLIKITWNPPSHLTGNGSVTYDIYRRKEGDTGSWTKLNTGPLTATSYIDSDASLKGSAYEYLVKVLLSGAAISPYENQRYVQSLRGYMDDNHTSESKNKGFMLNNPKIISASRTQLGDAASGYYELIDWYSSGIESSSHNRGVAGYEIQVMNRNRGATWETITTIPVTSSNSTYTFSAQAKNNELLKVLRDYKHYFRVRAYAIDYREDGEVKIYSEFPETWQKDANTDYIKWGARQITPEEFTKAACLAMSIGINQVNGGRWSWTAGSGSENAGSPGSGTVKSSSGNWVTEWTFKYENYKPPLTTKAGDSVAFLQINGTFLTKCSATSQFPHTYGYGTNSFLSVIDPTGLNLYAGQIKFSNLYSDSASTGIIVKYPASAAEVQFGRSATPFPFKGEDYLNDEGEWK